MNFDFKREYKEYYRPKTTPSIITIPQMNYIAARGKGNPNEEGGEYKNLLNLLYSVAYTIKMSYKTDYKIDGFFKYVVPPLEGFWWHDDTDEIDYENKDNFNFISVIRLPEFVKEKDFLWAKEEATRKKKQNFERIKFFTYDEGECVQCMHIGSFNDEPKTIALMYKYIKERGYENDITKGRMHHEIYLSDPRKCQEKNMKTVIRHPIKK